MPKTHRFIAAVGMLLVFIAILPVLILAQFKTDQLKEQGDMDVPLRTY